MKHQKEEEMKTKTILFLLLSVMSFVFMSASIQHAIAQDVPRMSVEQLKEKLGAPGLIVIDVRTEHDWDVSDSKVRGAVREDPSTVESWASKYPKNQTIVLYCA
jgi:predicted sulfurtransferase